MSLKKYEHLDEVDTYFKEIKNYRHLTRREEIELSKKIQNGDEISLERLVTSNLKFVVNIAKTYRSSGVPFSDLISEGNIGLIKAAKKFDCNKNVKFISYAVWWIKNSIQECIDRYETPCETNNVDDYVFNVSGCEDKYNLINEDFENELAVLQSRKDSVDELMKCLKERELLILASYFGLYDNKEKTLDEIGAEMNLTKERVRQIKDKALIKLRAEALMSSEFDEMKNLR